MRLIIRLIQFVLWVVVATWLGRKLFGWLFGDAERGASQGAEGDVSRGGASGATWGAASPPASSRAGSAPTSASMKGRKLHRDPVCGTHVPEGISVPLDHQGEVLHFCSVECREKFSASARASQSSRAGAASA